MSSPLHPQSQTRLHRLVLQLCYDGGVIAQTRASLVAPNGRTLPYGHSYFHRLSPALWWLGTVRHHSHAAMAAQHAHLGLAAPPGPQVWPVHLHPEGHPYLRRGDEPEPAAGGLAPDHHWRPQGIEVLWDYEGTLLVQMQSVLHSPEGHPVPDYSHSHDYRVGHDRWSVEPLRLLIHDALLDQHDHWGLERPDPRHVPMHLHPQTHPAGEHVMPDGPLEHPALPLVTPEFLRAHAIAQKQGEINGTRPRGRAPHVIQPASHPLTLKGQP